MTQTPRKISADAANFSRFRDFAESFTAEVVTHSRLEDVELPDGAGPDFVRELQVIET